MNIFRLALNRMHHVLPVRWHKKTAPPNGAGVAETSADSRPQALTHEGAVAQFPCIDWSEVDKLVDHSDPLYAVDCALRTSPRYQKIELPERYAFGSVIKASQ